jgi:hypothetical protein
MAELSPASHLVFFSAKRALTREAKEAKQPLLPLGPYRRCTSDRQAQGQRRLRQKKVKMRKEWGLDNPKRRDQLAVRGRGSSWALVRTLSWLLGCSCPFTLRRQRQPDDGNGGMLCMRSIGCLLQAKRRDENEFYVGVTRWLLLRARATVRVSCSRCSASCYRESVVRYTENTLSSTGSSRHVADTMAAI